MRDFDDLIMSAEAAMGPAITAIADNTAIVLRIITPFRKLAGRVLTLFRGIDQRMCLGWWLLTVC